MRGLPESGSTRAGRTTISARALRSLITGLARECARVPSDDISVTVRDVDGSLAVGVALPFTDSPASGSVQEHAALLRDGVINGMGRLASRSVGTVDVRFTAVRRPSPKRVL